MSGAQQKFCQSCCMPLGENGDLCGTNADGSKNGDYCKYCFENGKFTFKGTMEELIDFCTPHMVAAHPEMSEAEAKKIMADAFPKLKRWKRA